MIKLLAWLMHRLICSTLRYKVKQAPVGPSLFAAWHGQSFPLFYWAQHLKLCLLPVANWRGDILAYLANKYGYQTVRFKETGTPLERSEQLVQLLDLLKQGYSAAIAVDGPPKPMVRHQAKPGILYLSRKSGLPVVPIGLKLKKKLTLAWRWDKYEIPLPWSEVEINFGRPFVANEKTTTAELEGSLARLGKEARNEE